MTLAGLATGGLALLLTQYLQFVQGYTPLQAGLRFLPIAIGFGIASPITQRLVPRIGTARTAAAALGGVAVVFAALSLVGPDTSYWLVGPALLLVGLGIGAAFVPATDAVMAAVPAANAGLGSAINDAGRQVGAALGVGWDPGGSGQRGIPVGDRWGRRIAEPGPGRRRTIHGRRVADRRAGRWTCRSVATSGGRGRIHGRLRPGHAGRGVLLAAGALTVLWRLPAHDVPPTRM